MQIAKVGFLVGMTALAAGLMSRSSVTAEGKAAAKPIVASRCLFLDQWHIEEGLCNDFGIMIAFSPDRIHGTKHPGWVIPCYSDTGKSVVFDSRIGKYVEFGRFHQMKDSPAFYIGRHVARVESNDSIHWSGSDLVIAGDGIVSSRQ